MGTTHDDRDEPAVDEVARDGPEGAPAAQGLVLVLGLVHAVVVQAHLPHDNDDLRVVQQSPLRGQSGAESPPDSEGRESREWRTDAPR